MSIQSSELIRWLLSGDVSVQYQTKRDLLGIPEMELNKLQLRISEEGWGKAFLDKRDPETYMWGNGIYSPKWISTHYTLLDLKNIGIHPSNKQFRESCELLIDKLWFNGGKVRKNRLQDLCVSAMCISICCYAGIKSEKINEIIDYLLEKQYSDGGWNCNWHAGDKHSSVHTALCVLEAFRDYEKGGYSYQDQDRGGYSYRINEIRERLPAAWEFILKKRLFRSVRSGEIIDKKFIMLSFPGRWKYDILRCLDYFQSIDKTYDDRMSEALDILIKKRNKNGRWPVQQKYSGLIHFDMEDTGGDSRWNTLRVLRVTKKYRRNFYREVEGDSE